MPKRIKRTAKPREPDARAIMAALQILQQEVRATHDRVVHEALIMANAIDLINNRIDSLPGRIDTIGRLNLSAEQRAALGVLLANGHDT